MDTLNGNVVKTNVVEANSIIADGSLRWPNPTWYLHQPGTLGTNIPNSFVMNVRNPYGTHSDTVYSAPLDSVSAALDKLPHTFTGGIKTTVIPTGSTDVPNLSYLQGNYTTLPGSTYNVNNYGIFAGASDNTVALQTLINLVVANGGGTILFPYSTSTYKAGGALNGTTNSQLYIPADTVGISHISLSFVGEVSPSMIDFGQASTPRSSQGSIIESTLLGATGSILASMPGASYGGTFNNVSVNIKNMEFRTATISGGTDIAGQMSGIDASNLFEFTFDNLKLSTSSRIWNSIQPSATYKTYGVKMQAINSLYQSGNGTLFTQGYYYGIVLGEHTLINRYVGIGDYIGIQTSNGYHDATILHTDLECNKINIQQNGRQNLNITDYNTEHCYTIAGGKTSEWYSFGYDITNPTSTIGIVNIGAINVVNSSVGQVNNFFTDGLAVYRVSNAFRTSTIGNIVNLSYTSGYYNITPSVNNTAQFIYLPSKGDPTGYGGGFQLQADSTVGHQIIMTHGGSSTGNTHSNNKFILRAGAQTSTNADPLVIGVGPGGFNASGTKDLISLFPATQHVVIGNTHTDATDGGVYDVELTGTNLGFTGLSQFGAATEKTALNSSSLNFNMNPNGQIFNTVGYGYTINHTSSTTNTSDFTSIIAYNPASTSLSPSIAATPLSWNAAGNVSIGYTANTTSKLKISAGNSTTAEIQLSAGSGQTTMQAGSIDWQGTQLRFAHTAGNPLQFVLTNTANPTDGQIPFGVTSSTSFSTATPGVANGVTYTPSTHTWGLGAITPTTVNGNTWTTGTGTLTLGAGKTFTVNNSLTLAGTDGTTETFLGVSGTIPVIVGNGLNVSLNTTSTAIASHTPASSTGSQYVVNWNLSCKTSSTPTLTLTYTDPNAGAQTITLYNTAMISNTVTGGSYVIVATSGSTVSLTGTDGTALGDIFASATIKKEQ
ncbi:MAG: hypothetical protein P4L31_07500 [Candidatus Babeliales bacterium]|nr:hypothetical protein [Candidatus Babeliales bacterium]